MELFLFSGVPSDDERFVEILTDHSIRKTLSSVITIKKDYYRTRMYNKSELYCLYRLTYSKPYI